MKETISVLADILLCRQMDILALKTGALSIESVNSHLV